MSSHEATAIQTGSLPAAGQSPSPMSIDRATTRVPFRARIKGSLALPVLSVIVLIVAIGVTQSNLFVSEATWSNILRASSFIIIVACFEAIVMIAGGFDLSVGASFLAGSMTAAYFAFYFNSVPLAFLGAVVVGIAVGSINGLLTNALMISPIIATLGTMFGVTAIVVTLSGGLSIGPLPEEFSAIGNAKVGFVPGVFIYALAIAALVHIMLQYTDFGTQIRAIGGNRGAAEKMGVRVKGMSIVTYILAGAFSALAGLLQASSLASGSPTFGTGMALSVVAAVVIGGVSVYGAVGTIPGVVAGAVLLSLITVGLVILRISGSMQDFFVGLVLIIAVAVDRLRKDRMFKTSLVKVEKAS